MLIRIRRGPAAEWAAANPVLQDGELGLETDTRAFKVGNGTSVWTALTAVGGGGGTSDYNALTNKPTLGSAAATASGDYCGAAHGSLTTTAHGGLVAPSDSRLSDARTPTAHSHAPADVTGTAVVTGDARLTDARTPTTHAHADGTYRTLLTTHGSHVAGKVAGKYMLGQGDPCAVSGTGTLYPVAVVPIYAADYPTANGVAAKLRIRAVVAVNNTAPTGAFTVGLYPVTSGAGAAALKIYTAGTLVTGSACATVTTPAGSSMASVVSSDFALPADGLYVLAVVTTATVATASLVHIHGHLQVHNA